MFKNIFQNRNFLKDINKIDYTLLWVVLILLTFGLVIIYSATSTDKMADKINGNYNYYLIKQLEFIIGISIGCFVLSLFPMRVWFKYSKLFIAISIFLLTLVLKIGVKFGLTRRWIHLGLFNIQPSELFKLAMIIFLAGFISREYQLFNKFKNFKKVFFLPLLGIFLVYLGGDLGSCIILFLVFVYMLFIGGFKKSWLAIFLGLILVFVLIAIYITPYRFKRVTEFINFIFSNGHSDSNFQIKTAIQAISNGGFFGLGLGNSYLARFYLPELHTDFIYAFLLEELGIIMGLIIILSFLWIFFRAYKIWSKSQELEEYFSAFLAQGIICLMGLQVLFNIGVNIGLLPSTGLPLPFISYGGSSLLVNLVSITFLLRIDYENKRKMLGYKI